MNRACKNVFYEKRIIRIFANLSYICWKILNIAFILFSCVFIHPFFPCRANICGSHLLLSSLQPFLQARFIGVRKSYTQTVSLLVTRLAFMIHGNIKSNFHTKDTLILSPKFLYKSSYILKSIKNRN